MKPPVLVMTVQTVFIEVRDVISLGLFTRFQRLLVENAEERLGAFAED